MAQKSGFFNSLSQDGLYDRKYNANDYSDNLAAVISNGVLRSANNDLQVTASGRVVSVAAGRAWIDGHYYKNDSTYTFAEVTAPTGGSRYDRVMLRLNNQLGSYGTTESRNISLVYVQGTAANEPAPPTPTRTETIYDLVLATIYIAAGASALTVTDNRGTSGLCDWLYSNSKGYLFMRYSWSTMLASATSTVQFNIPQYETNKGFLEVYVNGILDSRYTLNNNILTFTGALTAGTKVEVKFYKSIEASGIDSVAGAITTLQNQMSQVQGTAKFTYQGTGLNDNVALSEIANAIRNKGYTVGSLSAKAEAFLSNIGGNQFLNALSDIDEVKINVVGAIGATSAYQGAGTQANPYLWFVFAGNTTNDLRVKFDFANAKKINIACGNNTTNVIFAGADLFVDNVNCQASNSGTNCNITMISANTARGIMQFNNCRFVIVTSGTSIIAVNGDFINCEMLSKSTNASASCITIYSSDALSRLTNCKMRAYTAGPGDSFSSVFYISSAATQGVIMANNINAPTVLITGYRQVFFAITNEGMTFVRGVTTLLYNAGDAERRNIEGMIAVNKP